MGLFKTSNKRKKSSSPTDAEIKEIAKDLDGALKKIRAENKAWKSSFNEGINLRQHGQELEKQNDLENAIKVYLKAVNEGESDPRLHIYNYAYDIERVIILYSKTKQTELLMQFLREKIEKYPDFGDAEKWKARLIKLESKSKK